MSAHTDAKREALNQEILLYVRQMREVNRALRLETNPATKVQHQMNLEEIERKLEIAEKALQALENEAEGVSSGLALRRQDNKLRQALFKLDFEQAKSICEATILHARRRRQQPVALLMLHNIDEMAGDLYVDDLKQRLQAGNPEFRQFLVEFGLMRPFSETALLKSLAEYFDVPANPDRAVFAEKLIDKICGAVGKESTFLFEFRLIDDPFLHQEFPKWLMTHFWHPLVDQFRKVHQQKPRAKLVALIVVHPSLGSSKLNSSYFCTDDQFAAERILHLPLFKWTQDDILGWLDDMLFGNLSEDEIEVLAERLFRISQQGMPRMVWQLIEKELGSMM